MFPSTNSQLVYSYLFLIIQVNYYLGPPRLPRGPRTVLLCTGEHLHQSKDLCYSTKEEHLHKKRSHAGLLAIAVKLDTFATLFKPAINAIVRNDEDDALK
jgi:hypothetical protein